MKKIVINKDLCTGCLSCSIACMSNHNKKHDSSVYSLDLADKNSIPFHYIGLTQDSQPVPIFCRHCQDPECVYTCMSGAMTKNPESGLVQYESQKCASCYMCVMACPYGVLRISPDASHPILKCDACASKGSPGCVENCPTGALSLGEEGGI